MTVKKDPLRDLLAFMNANILEPYVHRSILKSRRVVFNIKGNDFRLIVAVAYRYGAIYIKFVGTHKQYDAIDADTVEME